MANNHENQKKHSGRFAVIVILLLVVFAMLAALLLYFVMNKPAPEEDEGVKGGQREAAALKGSLNVMTEDEIQEELNRIVDEGMFRISIASNIFGVEGGEADVRIENNITNRYVMQVSLYLDETGEEIYATDLIDPGYYIERTEFDVPLEAGEYTATAIFTALYPDTEEIVGTVGAQVKLYIMPAGTTPEPTAEATAEPASTEEVAE